MHQPISPAIAGTSEESSDGVTLVLSFLIDFVARGDTVIFFPGFNSISFVRGRTFISSCTVDVHTWYTPTQVDDTRSRSLAKAGFILMSADVDAHRDALQNSTMSTSYEYAYIVHTVNCDKRKDMLLLYCSMKCKADIGSIPVHVNSSILGMHTLSTVRAVAPVCKVCCYCTVVHTISITIASSKQSLQFGDTCWLAHDHRCAGGIYPMLGWKPWASKIIQH